MKLRHVHLSQRSSSRHLTSPRRSAATWGNAGRHGGGPLITRREEARGSNPLTSTQPPMAAEPSVAGACCLPGAGAQQLESASPCAVPSMGALLSSDDFGSSVERTGKLHPLWQVRVPLLGAGGRAGRQLPQAIPSSHRQLSETDRSRYITVGRTLPQVGSVTPAVYAPMERTTPLAIQSGV